MQKPESPRFPHLYTLSRVTWNEVEISQGVVYQPLPTICQRNKFIQLVKNICIKLKTPPHRSTSQVKVDRDLWEEPAGNLRYTFSRSNEILKAFALSTYRGKSSFCCWNVKTVMMGKFLLFYYTCKLQVVFVLLPWTIPPQTQNSTRSNTWKQTLNHFFLFPQVTELLRL